MTTPADRLKKARERAKFASPTDAARAFGWKEPTYLAHENGTRGLRPGAAERYAKAFHCSAAWLLGHGPDVTGDDLWLYENVRHLSDEDRDLVRAYVRRLLRSV